MQRLVIAEKPSMAEAIALALGGARKLGTHWVCENGDTVTWCFGHLFEQATPESYDEAFKVWSLATLPIVPDRWRKTVKSDARKQFDAIRKLAESASEAVNAGDPDREGNLLVDEVLEAIGWRKPTWRLWLQDLSEGGVRKALNAMRPNADYRGYTDAAEARAL